MTIEKNSFRNDRKNTDDSLGVEREKTNKSIVFANIAKEKQIDRNVEEERKGVDQDIVRARAQADSDRELIPLTTVAEEKKLEINEDILSDERSRIDLAMEQERSRADEAVYQERENKEIIEKQLLQEERENTDAFLAAERTSTDAVVSNATEKLSIEISEHFKTSVSLTTRDEFLAIVSHDLRNPLGAVSSGTELLLDESAQRNLSSDTVSLLRLIKRNVDTASRLIADILDVESMAAGKLNLEFKVCDICAIMSDAVNSVAHLAKDRNITIEQSITPDCSITCDHTRISQILSNLLGNAIKFTPEGGHIDLTARWTDGHLLILVKDSGPGVPEEKKNKIFEKFAQIGSKDRRGLGLGLYISKVLVEAHGGKLWVESSADKGSTFCIQLPKDFSGFH